MMTLSVLLCTALLNQRVQMVDDSAVHQMAARLALIALRAGMPTREQAAQDQYILAPDSVVVGHAEVVHVFADLPKPVRCEGSIRDRAVVVRCDPISTPGMLAMKRRSADSAIALHGEEIRRLSATPSADPLILVYGYLESALIPLSALEILFRDYDIVPYAMAVREPNPLAKTKGASAVIEFGVGEFREIEDSP